MLNASTWYGYVTNATSTNITITDYYSEAYYYGYGFTYSGNSVVGGTLTSYYQYDGGYMSYAVTGMAVDARLAASLIQSNNLPALFSIIASGDDVFDCSLGSDIVITYGGNDTIYGRSGYDDLWGGAGADYIDGGADFDYARYDFASSGVYVRLDTGYGYAGEAYGDRLVSIEGLVGSSYDDTIVGDVGANDLFGRGGNDWIYGQEGSDYIFGDVGNDYLWGGVGDDDIDGAAGTDTALFAGLRRAYGISSASFDATGASVQVIGPEGSRFHLWH